MPPTPDDPVPDPALAQARRALEAAGQLPDEEIDVAAIALQLARIDAPEADWRAAERELSLLARGAAELADAGGTPERRRQLLAGLIHDRFGFIGDRESYDDLANANLIRVVERRRGLPVALGVVWLHAAEAAGWAACGCDFPTHFLLRLEAGDAPLLVDVFAGGIALDARALRAMVKRIEGERAELRPALLRPMRRREVLLRLQNNIKLRRLATGDLEGGLAAAEDMLRFAPDGAPLWREAGLIARRLGHLGRAVQCLDRALELAPTDAMAESLRVLLAELRTRLN
jgi:regulator of sirC expression with transglutaminase-like and TPR domain